MQETKGPEANNTLFTVHFSELKDPRRTGKGNFRHLLSDILFLTISAIISGSNDWPSVLTFGECQLAWLRQFGSFSNGLPSQDTLERVFAALNPSAFNTCFINWIKSIRQDFPGEVVAVDGKTMRGAKDKKTSKGMPHIVSAWAAEDGLCLGQEKVSKKSNEITAIPKLLDALAIKGCTVTVDAMGCQKKIAEKVIEKGADYILAVKGNQPKLEQAIEDTVSLEKPDTVHVMNDCGHGRIETRTCKAYSNFRHIENIEEWRNLKTLFIIETSVYKKSTGKVSSERRLYISSLSAEAEMLNWKTRSHWSVENNLHWTLDVTFGEDASRKRKGNEAENFNMLLKTALGLLSNDSTKGKSKKNKMYKASMDSKYREKLLGI